ncbi:unnamed protein product [Blepharisma stoltei]|uniref:RING-type domain-containing protein n=1 Tax=Blepharisma stoltei TaxID=1481888 RepID=A0AAU9K086_9CILI|nr:unnamed protein product [Blepharisma stoltei]
MHSLINRKRFRQADGSLIQGIPSEVETFIKAFPNEFYQIKEIPDDQDIKKQYIIAALFECFFFYRLDEFSCFEKCIINFNVETNYPIELIRRFKIERMQFLDKEFGTEMFKNYSVWLVNFICKFNQIEGEDFDHRMLKNLTQSLPFRAVLVRNGSKIFYTNPSSMVTLIIYLCNGAFYIFYPKITFNWDSIYKFIPEKNSLQTGKIKFSCFCLVNLPAHLDGFNQWLEITKMMEICPKCASKNTSIDREIIKKFKKDCFFNKCFYCRQSTDLISFENIDYSFCRSCIVTYRNSILKDIGSIANQERFDPIKAINTLSEEIREIEKNYFTCYNCRCLNINKNDPVRRCFTFSPNISICRICIKNMIDSQQSEFKYQNLKDLSEFPNYINVIKADREFLELFCVRCNEELASKKHIEILNHETCIQRYCQKCLSQIDVEECCWCGNLLINTSNNILYDMCISCNKNLPKSVISEGICKICKTDSEMDMETEKESRAMIDIKKYLKTPLNWKKVNNGIIEISPEFRDDRNIYVGNCLIFKLQLDRGYISSVWVIPVIYHPNFNNDGKLSSELVLQKLRTKSISDDLRSLFKILYHPNESFIENEKAFKLWKNNQKGYNLMAKIYLNTSGLENS